MFKEIILPVLVYVVKNVTLDSPKVRQEKGLVIFLITKEVGIVRPRDVKASAPRASYYNPGR